jgi:hypothetical protein
LIELAPNKDGSIPTFKLASMGKANRAYTKALDKATKPYRSNINGMGNDLAESIFMKVFVATVLKDWQNVQQKDGSAIPFSEPNAIELFKKLPRLYDDLQEKAKSVELFKAEEQEADAKN